MLRKFSSRKAHKFSQKNQAMPPRDLVSQLHPCHLRLLSSDEDAEAKSNVILENIKTSKENFLNFSPFIVKNGHKIFTVEKINPTQIPTL